MANKHMERKMGKGQVGRNGFLAHSSVSRVVLSVPSHVAPPGTLPSPSSPAPTNQRALTVPLAAVQDRFPHPPRSGRNSMGRSLVTGGHQTSYVPVTEGSREWPFSPHPWSQVRPCCGPLICGLTLICAPLWKPGGNSVWNIPFTPQLRIVWFQL